MGQLLEYAEIFLSYLVYMLLLRGGLEGCSEEPENARPGQRQVTQDFKHVYSHNIPVLIPAKDGVHCEGAKCEWAGCSSGEEEEVLVD